jgi:hypothetical protein
MTNRFDPDRQVSVGRLVELAAALATERGVNTAYDAALDRGTNPAEVAQAAPEYDRALAELVCDAAGLPQEHKVQILRRLRAANDHFHGR